MGTMASKYGRGSGDISSFYGAAQRISCRNRPFYDLPMWVNGKTADLADKIKSSNEYRPFFNGPEMLLATLHAT